MLIAWFAAAALAQSPLVVTATELPLYNADLLADAAPADGVPDGWVALTQAGSIRVEPAGEDNTARVTFGKGTKGTLCSAEVSVREGATLDVSTRVRGEPGLGDVTAMHVHISGAGGPLHTARRRFDVGAFPWEDVSVRATVPQGGTRAFVCFDVQMVNAEEAGSFQVAPVTARLIEAESRLARLPVKRIILVSIETFRWDHVHSNGYPRATTPNIDGMLADGFRFDRHYVPAPYTHPSLASMLTGQLPTTLGFVDNVPTLSTGAPTLAELMAQAGYVTAGFNVQYVLSNRYGLNRGFHYYRNHPNDTPANVLNDELFPWLTAHAQDNVFVWVHYFDPHGPYRPPARFRGSFSGDQLWTADSMAVERGTAAEGAPTVPKYIFDNGKTERRHYVAAYDADIAWTDFEVGRLLDYLRLSGQEDTLVVLTADHGESMTDHNRYFCHGSLYNHDLHVPMGLWGPGVVEGGGRADVLTSHTDIVPTLLDYAGAGALPGFAGASLRPLVEGGAAERPPFVVSVVGRADRLRYAVMGRDGTKIITDRYGALEQAYDLRTDPGELTPLAGKARRSARLLAKSFKSWLAGRPVTQNKVQALDKEDEERLRALGYIE